MNFYPYEELKMRICVVFIVGRNGYFPCLMAKEASGFHESDVKHTIKTHYFTIVSLILSNVPGLTR